MDQKTAKNDCKCDGDLEKDFEKKFEAKAEKWANSCGKKTNHGSSAGGGAVYCLGFIGAAIYYISTAGTFWIGVLGFLKALAWPGFLVYELLKFLSK